MKKLQSAKKNLAEIVEEFLLIWQWAFENDFFRFFIRSFIKWGWVVF